VCRDQPNTLLIEERGEDVMPWLKAADVLVTDASSVQLEFLALDRPLVLLDNPERAASIHFDPKGLEWVWRDMGDAIENVEVLPAALSNALDYPRERAPQRAIYRERLFGQLVDGRSGSRLAEHIDRISPQVASEAQLLAASPVGRAVHTVLP